MNNTISISNERYEIQKLNNNSLSFIWFAKTGNTNFTQQEFILTPISIPNIIKERLCGKPGMVVKVGTSLYFTRVDKGIRFASACGIYEHLCANCNRLTSNNDSHNACTKVRDIPFEPHLILHTSTLKELFRLSKFIEKYNFITLGFETFNTSCDSFLVLECDNYTSFNFSTENK